MRDPDCDLIIDDETVTRKLRQPLSADHFLRTRTADKLRQSKSLVSWVEADPHTLVSPRIPFVTYPYEWTDHQLRAAADLTLDLGEAAYPEGFELKDASAWNVIFDGTAPTFCDLTSFVPIQIPQWWAFGQFARHFIFPLVVSHTRGIKAYECFRMGRDGMQPDVARRILGLRRFLTRAWPLMVRSRARVRTGSRKVSSSARLHLNLYGFARSQLRVSTPSREDTSVWSKYAENRAHYRPESLASKQATVSGWLSQLKPAWVTDVGCNTGEFTRLARSSGARVVAIDQDHDAVDQLYRALRGDTGIFPLCADFADLSGGGGWAGEEIPGLVARLAQCTDVLLLLAVIHHMAISAAIPLPEIARLARRIVRRALIVELIAPSDPMLRQLCAERRRDPQEFSLDTQRAAFAALFRIVQEQELPCGNRRLLLCEPI
jgi:SAM-dependent methyltransferase